MLSALEFAAIVAMAFFGIFGSLVDFRDSRGKVSLKGWIALVGVIMASSTVGSLQIYSSIKDDEQTLSLLEKNTIILSEISRSLTPLRGLEVDTYLTSDWTIGRLNDYFSEFERTKGSPAAFGWSSLPSAFCGEPETQTPPQIQTEESSPGLPELVRLPSCGHGQVIHDVFCPINVTLLFYKTPIMEEEFEYNGIGDNYDEDLRIDLRNPCFFARVRNQIIQQLGDNVLEFNNIDAKAGLEYEVREGKLLRLDFGMQYGPEETSRNWMGNSSIISLHDLLGSQLIIQLDSGTLTTNEIKNLQRTITLRQLILKISNGIAVALDRRNLKHYKSKYFFPFYSIRFPSDMEELLSLTAYNRFSRLD